MAKAAARHEHHEDGSSVSLRECVRRILLKKLSIATGVLRDQIFTYPTMNESLNNLLFL